MGKTYGPYLNRGPIEYTSVASPVTFGDSASSPPIPWIRVVTAGSGGLVVKAEDGTSRTYTGLRAGETLIGPFSEITSMTCSKIRAGDGPPPPADPASSAFSELYTNATTAQAQVNVPLGTAILAAGTPMAAFADNAGASAPGVTLANSKAVGIRWNNFATQTAVWFSVPMPQDLNDAAAIVLHALVSKTGATVGDATTLTVTAFFQTVGALHDADSDRGGTSSAVTGNATAKTVAEITLSISASAVPPSPAALSFSIKPTDGTLGTDDFIVHAVWFEYTRAILTA